MKPLNVAERQAFSTDAEFTDSRWDDRSVGCGSEASSLQEVLQATRRSVLTAEDLSGIQAAAIDYLRRTCQPVLLAWYHPSGSQIGQADRLEGLLCPTEGISASLQQHLKQAALECSRRNEITTVAISTFLHLFSMPVASFPGHSLLIVTELNDVEGVSSRTELSSLLVLTSLFNERAFQQAGSQAAENARTVAALIELVGRVQASDDAQSACQRLTDSLQQHLLADKVVVGICRRGLTDCRLTAISAGAVIDPFSEETRLIESVLQESLVRSAGAVWPVIDFDNRHALLAHQQLVESGFGKTIVSMPIQTETGTAIGSVVVVFAAIDGEAPTVDRIREAAGFLRAGAGALAGCLSVLQKLADSRWLQVITWIRKSLTTSRLQLAGWIVGGLSVAMLIPMNYNVKCSLELQPVERHYVAAPFAGPLEKCLVEPGDIVVKDQLLARMDGREIRWELAEVRANLNKATKERNTQLSSREFGSAAISGHEIQRLEQRAALLAHRDTSLEIRSSADGVVVSGDHREAEGVPLEMGQTLFEIAPLDAMVVELCVPEADIRHLLPGMTATIQLDAIPEESIEATIRSIHPRAELRDGENVFVAEADIPNDPQILRPGMRGTARINTGRHALGWNLFHKPVAWLLGWLGW